MSEPERLTYQDIAEAVDEAIVILDDRRHYRDLQAREVAGDRLRELRLCLRVAAARDAEAAELAALDAATRPEGPAEQAGTDTDDDTATAVDDAEAPAETGHADDAARATVPMRSAGPLAGRAHRR